MNSIPSEWLDIGSLRFVIYYKTEYWVSLSRYKHVCDFRYWEVPERYSSRMCSKVIYSMLWWRYRLRAGIYCLPSIAEIRKKVETKILDFFYIYICERGYLLVSKMCSLFRKILCRSKVMSKLVHLGISCIRSFPI